MISDNSILTKDEFIANIQDEISVACALPFSIPRKEIERIMDMAAKWFYKNDEDAVEERYFVIPVTAFDSEEFKRSRTIKLPDCIQSVFRVNPLRESFGRRTSFDGTADFGIERMFLSDSGTVGETTESLMYYVINLSWLDLSNHILNHTIGFNYNRNSNKLFFSGGKPDRDCVVSCDVKLPLEYLMKEELFFRYVSAKCKIQLARILGTFDFKYPGDITINYDTIKSEGQDELDKVEQEIKDDESMDFFFTTGGA